MELCSLCPRECLVNRQEKTGACGCSDKIKVAKHMLHMWEEPPISGKNGSGAIFFSGCPLKCVYCQNKEISHAKKGYEITNQGLADIMLELQDGGAHNINLVTPTHYSSEIIKAIELTRGKLKIPVVYNTSGYEKSEEIRKIADYVSVFLADIKYFSPELSKRYSSCENYYKVAKNAFLTMLELKPRVDFDSDGIMTSGVILRHLVLPSCRRDSIDILTDISKSCDISTFKLSLMSQYTPDFCCDSYPELKRRVTTFEYDSVVKCALSLGYDGYIQDKSSASSSFTPDFN